MELKGLAAKTRAVSAKGVEEFRPYITRALPITAELVCADNTGAKVLRIAQVGRYKGRHSRLPAAAVGDMVTVTVKKGASELRKQIFGAVIIRQKYAIKRLNGVRLSFEDNAAVLVTPEGEIKGTDIKGPVAAEAAEKWPRIANLASVIV
jgi:large subunit ribosomal protein L14